MTGSARRVAACLAVVVVVVLVSACAKPETPEDAVRRSLHEAVAAIEQADVGAAGALLSDAYVDDSKRTKQQMKGIALFVLRRGPVLVGIQDVKVDVVGDTATATFKAFAVQGAAEVTTPRDLLPQRAREFALTTMWAKEDGAWRVRSISGDGAGGSAFE